MPMSIGSAFDAFAKNFLHQALFGVGNDPRFDLETLFQAQVEPQNRDWAWKNGAEAFKVYKATGALNDLMVELQSAVGTPRFEIDIMGQVSGHREGITKNLGPVTFLGKPDCFYINKQGTYVVLDWKVNGYCSTRNTSPMPGYTRIRAASGAKPSGPHKDCLLSSFGGQLINVATYLELLNEDWARQLTIYNWLCGGEVGETFIAAIDQLACSPSGLEFPLIRIAEHRLRVGSDYQWNTFAEAEELWNIVNSDHIFRDMEMGESQDRCKALEGQATGLAGKGDPHDNLFASMCQQRRAY